MLPAASERRRLSGTKLSRVLLGLLPWNLAVQAASFGSSIALAWVLGAGAGTDAYFVGLSVPVFVYSVLLVAVRSGAISPLTELLRRGGAEFDRAASQLVSAMAVASFVCSLALTAAAVLGLPPLLGGGAHFAYLARITIVELAPLGVFGALTGVFGALLAVRGIFAPQVAVMAIEPALKTAFTLTLGHQIGAQALVAGNLIGSATAAAVLWYVVRREGIAVRIGRPIDTPVVRNVVALSAPLLVSSSVLQINPIVDRTMSAEIGRGSVTSLELGLRLLLVPTTLISTTLISPLTATWAARQLEGGWPPLRESLARILRMMSMTLPPVLVLGYLLKRQLISIVYHGGSYPAHALHVTTQVFGMLLLGLPAQICVITLATLFVVYRDTVFNMKIGIANVVLNVLLNWALRPLFGVPGIALSTTITFTLLAGVYVFGMNRRWGGLPLAAVRTAVRRAVVSAAATALVCVAVLHVLPAGSSRGGLMLVVLAVASTGLLVHGLVLSLERNGPVLRLLSRMGQAPATEALEP